MTGIHTHWKSVLALTCVLAGAGCSLDRLPTGPVGRVADYAFVAAWGDSGSGPGQFFYPQGVEVDAAGHVYVVDTANRRIQEFTNDGAYITQWGGFGSGPGQFGYMNDLAIDTSGDVYVADAGNSRIQKFTSDGQFLMQWGAPGSLDGQFNDVGDLGVAVDHAGHVYVLDSFNNRVQKFTSDGAFISKWGEDGNGDGTFIDPRGIAVDRQGDVYVMDGRTSVERFSPTGSFRGRWEFRTRSWGSERVSVDGAGRIYVTDHDRNAVIKSSGRSGLVTQLPLGADRFEWTPDVAIDAQGNLFVTDARHGRILKFAPAQRLAVTQPRTRP